LIGGQIATAFGWRVIFFVLAGISAVLLLGLIFILPETLPPEARRYMINVNDANNTDQEYHDLGAHLYY